MIRHESQRGYFAHALHKQMAKDQSIWMVTGDLGYGMLDAIKEDYPERFINVGAAEQTMLGVSVGLAMSGKKPFTYSITPFLLYRGYETIRNYIDHEQIPVRLVGGGRDMDYAHDGFSHWACDDAEVIARFKNICGIWPETKEELPDLVEAMVECNKPWYLNLRR